MLRALVLGVSAGLAAALRFEIDAVHSMLDSGVLHTPSTCSTLSTFSQILTAAAAGGSAVDVTGRTVFAPQDSAWNDLLSSMALSRAQLFALPASALADIAREHLTAASGAAITTGQTAAGGAGLSLSMASGSILVLGSEMRPDPSAADGAPTRVLVVNPGASGSNATVTSANNDCLGGGPTGALRGASVVHVIDKVLQSPLSTSLTKPGPYQVQSEQTKVSRSAGRGGGSFPVELLHPVSSAQPWPAIVFSHGMRAPVAVYRQTLIELVGRGYIVASLRGNLDIDCPTRSCNYSQLNSYVDDVADTVAWLFESANAMRPASAVDPLLIGRVDPKPGIGLMGHSLGGGISIHAAARAIEQRRLPVTAVFALAPANGNICLLPGAPANGSCPTSAIAARLDAGSVQLSILAGYRDSVEPVAANAEAIFASSTAKRSLLSVLARGTHCFSEVPSDIMDGQCGGRSPWSVDPAPAAGCADATAGNASVSLDACLVLQAGEGPQAPSRPPLPQQVQLLAARRSASLFFSAVMGGSEGAARLLWGVDRQPLFTDVLMREVASREGGAAF